MNNRKDYSPVNASQGLESLRASNFDTYSAIAELIDNSIQAYANVIDMEFIANPNRASRISSVVFCDDGHGMGIDTLRVCLGLGDGTRINDRKGIGRFGVGMTLGAIHECRKVEVYSKQENGPWHYTYLDLDYIKDGGGIPYPILKDPEGLSNAKIPTSHGTVIVWSKYDAPHDNLETTLIPKAKRKFGRMFRRFIWGTSQEYNQIKLTINGETVPAVDPLYYRKEFTGFEDEPKATLLPENTFSVDIPEQSPNAPGKSEVRISMSLLPPEYTRERQKGGDAFAKARHIDKNEGISILRNDREIFFGRLPYTTLPTDKQMRYIGIEIDFNAEIDSLFQVQNIKRGAKPIASLKEELVSRLRQPIKSQLLKITARWDAIDKQKEEAAAEENKKTGVTTQHAATQAIITEHKARILQTQKHKTDPEITPQLVNPEATPEEREALVNLLSNNGITINAAPLAGTMFIDIDHGSEGKLLQYNTRSTFYTKLNSILKEIGDKDKAIESDVRVLIDLIFCSYLLAEGTLDFSLERRQELSMDSLKTAWSNQLIEILSKWD